MKTFVFYHKNSSAVMTITAETFEDADLEVSEVVKDPQFWRCDDEDGEDNESF